MAVMGTCRACGDPLRPDRLAGRVEPPADGQVEHPPVHRPRERLGLSQEAFAARGRRPPHLHQRHRAGQGPGQHRHRVSTLRGARSAAQPRLPRDREGAGGRRAGLDRAQITPPPPGGYSVGRGRLADRTCDPFFR